MTKTLLFLHLLSAFLFVSGAVAAGIAQLSALRRERPSEIALLFRTARVGALFTSIGGLLTLIFGAWLVSDLDLSFGDAWISGALGLWLAAMVLGGLGGRSARHARELAERLAAEGDRPSEELRGLVGHRPSLLLSYAATVAILAVLVLMVWKPGA
jgi:uncharacterized membrane protein